jgi:hypothetical protein
MRSCSSAVLVKQARGVRKSVHAARRYSCRDHRAGHVGAPDLGELGGRRQDRRVDLGPPARAPDADDAGGSASRRFVGPGPGAHAPRSAASPGTRRGLCPTKRSATALALALGAWTGVSTTSAPSERKTSSKARQNFPSRSRGTKRTRRPCSSKASSRLRACWVTQAALGLAVTPARWTRRVSSSMKNSTYSRRSHTVSTVKQVAGEDPGGLLAQERPPGRARPPRGRVEPLAAQGGADRGGRGLHTKAEQLALDALVAPAGILGGQADDQLLDLWDELPVPAQQGFGLDQEARPACPWQRAADGGEESAVGSSSRGRGVLRRSTLSWWRSTRISRSLAASPRASNVSSWTKRHNMR